MNETRYHIETDFPIRWNTERIRPEENHPPSVETDLGAMLQTAEQLRNSGRPKEALEIYERVIELNPNLPRAWVGISHPLRDLGQYDRALDASRRALELVPEFPGAWHSYALVLSELKKPSEALEACRRTIALAPGFSKPWNVTGNCLSDLQRPEEAMAAYNKCIELEPDFSFPWENKAVLLLKYAEFFTSKPELVGPHETVGACYRRDIWLGTGPSRPVNQIQARRHSQTPLASWRWLLALNVTPQNWEDLRVLVQESLSHIAPILEVLPDLEMDSTPEGRRRLAVVSATFGDPFSGIPQWREIVAEAPRDFEAKWWLADQLLEVLELGEREQALQQAGQEAETALNDELPEGKRFVAGLIFAALGRATNAVSCFEQCRGPTQFLSLLWRWKMAAMIGDDSQKHLLAEEILTVDDTASKRGETSQFLPGDNLWEFFAESADVEAAEEDDEDKDKEDKKDEAGALSQAKRIPPHSLSIACETAMRKRWTQEVLLEFLEDTKTLESIASGGGNSAEYASRLLSAGQLAARSRAWGWVRAQEADVQTWITGERSRKIRKLESLRELQRLLSAMDLDATADPGTCEKSVGRFIQTERVRSLGRILRNILELLVYRNQISPETYAILEAYLRFKEGLEDPHHQLGQFDLFTKTFKDLGSLGTVPLAIMALTALNIGSPTLMVTGALAVIPLALRKLIEAHGSQLSLHNFPSLEEFKRELEKFGVQDWETANDLGRDRK